jgi:tRNA uridine 5-carboxymethylaminomethyl modification enzyme
LWSAAVTPASRRPLSRRAWARAALVSFDPDKIGAMSCNPAIGGLGKGHLVREVDAFDGVIARAADAGAIHYRMLNRSKGSAVQGPRVQADRKRFKAAVQAVVNHQPGLTVVAGEAAALRLAGGGSPASIWPMAPFWRDRPWCSAPALLGARLFRGEERMEGGRIGEDAAHRLAAQMRDAALPMARLKTGTPPRLDGRTIDWARLEEQHSDADPWTMSPLTRARPLPQIFCGISRTNARTHDIIRAGLIARPCSPARSARGGRAIARRSRTRSTALPIATATRSSSNPKAWTIHWSIPTASPPRCRPMCNWR